MPKIEVNLSEVHEPKPVSGGKKYALTIAEAEYREDKNDVRVSIGIDDHLDSPNITHFLSLPKQEDDERKAAFKQLMCKRFLVAFGIPHEDTEFDTDDFAGCTGEVEVVLSDPDDNGNVYNRLRLPRLANEEAGGEETPKAAAPARRSAAPPARSAKSAPAPARRR